MTQSSPSVSSHVSAQVREQVTRARQDLRLTVSVPGAAAAVDGEHRDFVRRYLRFLSVQAVGQFTGALGQLASGLDVLNRRTLHAAAKLAGTEQDVLHLAAALEPVRSLRPRVDGLEARLARVEAALASRRETPVGAEEEFIAAAARHLENLLPPVDSPSNGHGRGRLSLALGPVPREWLAAVARGGFDVRVVGVSAVRDAESFGAGHATDPEPGVAALASVTSASTDLVTVLGTFDALTLDDVRLALEHCRRVLRPDGDLLVVADGTPAASRPAFLRQLHPRVSDNGTLVTLVQEAGFGRVSERLLDPAWPTYRVVSARHA